MVTRIDEDIMTYCLAIQDNDVGNNIHIQRLLNAFQGKYQVSSVYIGQIAETGVTAFCNKPIFLSELQETLEKIVAAEGTPVKMSGAADGAPVKPSDTVAEDKDKKAEHSGRLLLVDDNELNREIALELLAGNGYEVDEAEDGSIAVEKVRNSRPGYYKAVLMDIQMPVMNGHEAARAIRRLENPELVRIPIIAITANAFEEDKREAFASGMDGFLVKPIDIEAVLGALEKY